MSLNALMLITTDLMRCPLPDKILDHSEFSPIAIVGVGSIFPGATDSTEFWKNIVQGRDFITDILPSHWLVTDYYDPNLDAPDKTYCKRAAFLPEVDFDLMEYGIPPNVLPAIDTAQLFALMVAKQTLMDTFNGDYQQADLSRVSVILGSSTLEAIQYMSARLQRPIWARVLQEMGLSEAQVTQACEKIAAHYTPLQENTFPGLLQNVIAGRIANRFNLGGTNCITDAACASSLAALSMSIRELQSGVCDMALTGGVDALNDIVMFMCFTKTKALSLTGDCRPFAENADGTILGEGVGMFALKRLTDAEAQGNKIYAVIRGLGTSSDGRSKSIYAPLAQGQAKATQRAYESAGYSLGTVELIEAHGTGTRAGDAAEFEGLTLAFKNEGITQPHLCALGSIKSQIGHTKAAAGAAGLFKAVMALKHKALPPTLKIDSPNPDFDLQHSPLYLNTQLRPWVHPQNYPRRASISSFGFGGSNYHLTLEEYTGNARHAKRLRSFPTELIVFAESDPTTLLDQLKSCLSDLNHYPSLAHLAYATQQTLKANQPARLAMVAYDLDNLRSKLQQAIANMTSDPEKSMTLKQGIYYGNGLNPGKVMFLFPGQGSQYVGMGADFALSFDACMQVWDNAAKLDFSPDLSIQDVVFPTPDFSKDRDSIHEKQLLATEWAQPALATCSLALLKLLQTAGINADMLAGHSFGELTALCAAGVMDDFTLLRLARKRGELMRDATQKTMGAMLSVIFPVHETIALLKRQGLKATPANFNAPNQLILSGSVTDIETAEKYFQREQIRCQRLSVATGFHSPVVESTCKPMRQFLSSLDFHAPNLPVLANTTAQPYPSTVEAIKDLLAQQIANPVRFQEQIEQAYESGVRTFIEMGSHHVLTGLVQRCLESRNFHAIATDRRGENGVTALWHALAQLFSIGLNPDFMALWSDYEPPKSFSKNKDGTSKGVTVKINGTNYGKPYPNLTKLHPMDRHPQKTKESRVTHATPPHSVGIHSSHAVTTSLHKQSTTPNPITKSLNSAASFISPFNPSPINEENDMSATHNPYLIQMYQSLQQQMIHAHNVYQKAAAESHIAFLNSMAQLASQTMTGQAMPTINPHSSESLNLTEPVASIPLPITPPPIFEPIMAPPVPHPTVSGLTTPTPTVNPYPGFSAPVPPTMPTEPVAQSTHHAAPTPPAPIISSNPAPTISSPATHQPQSSTDSSDLSAATQLTPEALLLEVVTEKTGYPPEMLTMEMAIEADLGIDSIKRVEILSALVQRAPHLPEISPADLSKLQTLGDIVQYMKEHSPR